MRHFTQISLSPPLQLRSSPDHWFKRKPTRTKCFSAFIRREDRYYAQYDPLKVIERRGDGWCTSECFRQIPRMNAAHQTLITLIQDEGRCSIRYLFPSTAFRPSSVICLHTTIACRPRARGVLGSAVMRPSLTSPLRCSRPGSARGDRAPASPKLFLVLEREREFGSVGHHFSIIDLQVHLDDFGDP
jgi:hypothetical protein